MTEEFPGTRKGGDFHLVTASTMPDCVATAAIAMHKLGMYVTLGPHDRPLELDVAEGDEKRRLYVIGTFWKNQLEELAKRFAQVYVYSFGDPVECPQGVQNICVFRDIERMGSAAWLLTQTTNRKEPVDPELMALINVRCFGQGDERVQTFFDGIYDYVGYPWGDMLTVFGRLVVGSTLTIKMVMERGKLLLANHRGIAAERVRKAALVTNWVAMVEGTELINHTHNALRAAHPTVRYTVVWRVNFTGSSVHSAILAISVRAWFADETIVQLQKMRADKTLHDQANDDIVMGLLKKAGLKFEGEIPLDAQEFLTRIGEPGGSCKAAGTTVPFLEGWELLLDRIKEINQ